MSLSVLAVFGRLACFDFVFFDDHVYVMEKAEVLAGLTPESLRWALTATDAGFWHPLTWLSLMADHELWGLNPGGYHLTNILLHLAATLLLFAGLHRLTGALWKSGVVAALFALHPLHVESVAWIAERKDVLSGAFWMLALLLYARYVERPGWGRYMAVLLSFLLGLAAKPMVVTLPAVLLLLDIWPLGRLAADNWRRRWPRIVGEKMPMLILGAVAGVVTVAAEQQVGALKTFAEFPLYDRLTNAVIAYAFYLYKTVLPFDLAVHYPHPGTWPAGMVVLSLSMLAAVTFLAGKKYKIQPFLLVGWLWYLISLLPVIGLLQIGSHAFADRYTYIPLIGVFIAVVWGVGDWVAEKGRARTAEQAGGYFRRGDDAGGGGDTGRGDDTGGGDGNGRGDEMSAPGEIADKNGNAGGKKEKTAPPRPGDDGPAAAPLAAWETVGIGQCVAASVKPGDPEISPAAVAVLTLAILVVFALISFRQVSYWQNAETLFRRAVAVTDNNWLAANNLGAALSRQGRYGEAEEQARISLQLRPGYVEALFNMGVALAGQGRYGEALPYYKHVLARQPRLAAAHNNIAIAYARTGNIEAAIAHFREAIRIRPDYEEARDNLRIAEKQR